MCVIYNLLLKPSIIGLSYIKDLHGISTLKSAGGNQGVHAGMTEFSMCVSDFALYLCKVFF